MPRFPHVPPALAATPFRGSTAVADGLLTWTKLRGRGWQRLLPDVYVHRDGHRPDDHGMWCAAVALVLPSGGAIGGPSAAYLWGVRLPTLRAPVTVVLPRAARMRPHPHIVVTRSVLPATDRCTRAEVPVTTAVRTAFDLGRRPPRNEAVVAVDALLHRALVDLPTLRAYAQARAGWPGLPLLREVLSLADPLSESPMETRLRLLLHDAGLPSPASQHEIHDGRGRLIGRVDLAYPAQRLAIEYDSQRADRQPTDRTAPPSLALQAAGWRVIRCTGDDVLRHPGRTVRAVSEALRGRPLARIGSPGSLPHR